MRRGLGITTIATFAVCVGLDILIYGFLLSGTLDIEPSFRPLWQGVWPKLIAADLIFAGGFVWIFRGMANGASGLKQGALFGLVVGLIVHGAGGLTLASVLLHDTETLIVGGIALGILRDIALGLVAGAMSAPSSPGTP